MSESGDVCIRDQTRLCHGSTLPLDDRNTPLSGLLTAQPLVSKRRQCS